MMYLSSLAFLLFFISNPIKAQDDSVGRTFVDDRGVIHTFTGRPKIAVRAGIGGRSLYHMGLPEEQLAAVWGLWGIRGSDYDPDSPENGSIYGDQDPSIEETNFLKSARNLSPGCYKNPRGCFNWEDTNDLIEMHSNNELDFVLFIDNAPTRSPPTNMIALEAEGVPVVFIDTFYDYDPACRAENYSVIDVNSCLGRSTIDIAQRVEALTKALVPDLDTTEIDRQRDEACASATSFTETMEEVHRKGIRVKVSILGTFRNFATGEDVVTVRDFDPTELWIPRTFEELGMPLLHSNGAINAGGDGFNGNVDSNAYFIDCPDGALSVTCNDNTLYPVDFWLFDSRSFALIDASIVEQLFPDKAALRGQMWHYARNDGPVSYVGIKIVLDEMAEKLSSAERVHDETECTPVDPKSPEVLLGGLDRNQYICYDFDLIQSEYLCNDSIALPGICFSGNNMVEVQGKGLVPMESISIGDAVRVEDGKFSTVYSFGHYDENVVADYLQIKVKGIKKPLELSKDHMLYVKSSNSQEAIAAGLVKVGDMVVSADGMGIMIESINNVKRRGAFAPFTETGNIVVSGVVASNYISLMETGLPVSMQWIAHTFNAPHRMICSLSFGVCEKESYTNGISNWVYGGFRAGKWLAKQSSFVQMAGSAFLFASLLGVATIEFVTPTMFLMLGVLVCLRNKNQKC